MARIPATIISTLGQLLLKASGNKPGEVAQVK